MLNWPGTASTHLFDPRLCSTIAKDEMTLGANSDTCSTNEVIKSAASGMGRQLSHKMQGARLYQK